jgi:hypothetical protein
VVTKYPLRACFAQANEGGEYTCPLHPDIKFTEKNHLFAYRSVSLREQSKMWDEKVEPHLFAVTQDKLREDLCTSQREEKCRWALQEIVLCFVTAYS